MKKLVTIMMVALVAISASAASIDWKFSGLTTAAKRIVDSTGVNYNGNIYLILADDAAALTATTTKETFESTLSSITVGTTTVADGKATNNTATDSSWLSQAQGGSQYDFQIVVYDGAQYYLSAVKSQYAYTDPTTPTSITFGYNDIGATYQNTSNVKYTAVPEPASAMLALAGVAMLIRRRK
ncbi:MAG: PEP-CTERM sorting domain-containing protein [Kiritimatiellae bacterium]|nr:PEP-CTERM sorting domain-containing protein [Kiritimatiellia bacterium]